jgi:hypothetical protein
MLGFLLGYIVGSSTASVSPPMSEGEAIFLSVGALAMLLVGVLLGSRFVKRCI